MAPRGTGRGLRLELEDPRLEFAVAVRADENALPGLLAVGGQRLSGGHAHSERLLNRVNVMEVEIRDAAVVSADRAAAAGLGDERPLDRLLSARYCLPDAPLAPPARTTLPVQRKLGVAVTHALANFDGLRAIDGRRSPARSPEKDRRWDAISRHERTFAEGSDAGATLRAGAWPEGRAADF